MSEQTEKPRMRLDGTFDPSPIRSPQYADDKVYPCILCGALRSLNDGADTFAFCSECLAVKQERSGKAKRPAKFVQIASLDGYDIFPPTTVALDEDGDVWESVSGGWVKLCMERQP